MHRGLLPPRAPAGILSTPLLPRLRSRTFSLPGSHRDLLRTAGDTTVYGLRAICPRALEIGLLLLVRTHAGFVPHGGHVGSEQDGLNSIGVLGGTHL